MPIKIGAAAKKRAAQLKHFTELIAYSKARGFFIRHLNHRKSLNTKALSLAKKQIGYKESPVGSNHTKFGVWYGMDHEPWCAIFVSWVLSHAGRKFKYSYVPYIVNDAKAGKNGLSAIPFGLVASALKRGHVVLACYDWPGESPGVADHIGFVEKVTGSARFNAIEGNTSPDEKGSQSNGGEVCRKTRFTSEVEAFVLVSR